MVGGRWQGIVVEKVGGCDRGRVEARLSSQGGASLHQQREYLPHQKTAALSQTDCLSGSYVAAEPPKGSGILFHRSMIQLASQDHQQRSRRQGSLLAEYLHDLV